MSTSSTSQNRSSVIPIPPSLDELIESQEEISLGETEVVEQFAQKRITEEPRLTLYGFIRERLGNIFVILFVVVTLIATIFYALDGKPLFPINRSSFTSTQPVATSPPIEMFLEPQFMILGQYGGRIYTFNRGVDKIYAYDPNNPPEREVISVPEFERFLWHDPGKLLLVSRVENALGNIYLYDLTQPVAEPELLTRREGAPNFLPNLRVDGSSELAWSPDGEAIAFTAQDIESGKVSLFIHEVGRPQPIYTPARNMDSISSLLWVTNTLTSTMSMLSFVAIDNGQEDRYFVDRTGGGYAKWDIE